MPRDERLTMRQARLMTPIWHGSGAPTRRHIGGKHNHLAMLEGPKDAQARTTHTHSGTAHAGDDR